MTPNETKPGRPPLNPAEPLDQRLRIYVSRRMKDALRELAGDRGMAAAAREFIAQGLEASARK